jgi:hypothetical protein
MKIRVYQPPDFMALLKKPSRLIVNDLLVLMACGQAVLKPNKELKGKNRRVLRTAVNRAKKFVESL